MYIDKNYDPDPKITEKELIENRCNVQIGS